MKRGHLDRKQNQAMEYKTMNLKKKSLSSAIASVMLSGVVVLGAVSPTPLSAANHPNSNVSAVENGVQYLDLTLSTDWDYDQNVVQKGTQSKTPRILNRQYLNDLVEQTARTLFVMTNGRHRIGNVYIYKNGKFGNNVDIRVLNTIGRANADGAGWRADGGLTTNNYITNCAIQTCDANTPDANLDPENAVQTGEVIAHELGHYVYGLYDEYVEGGKACSGESGDAMVPCKDDVERPTAMNNQAKAYRLSTAADYANNDFSKTAHGRVYGKSAWETLISNPENDSETAKSTHSGRRTYFDAFKAVSSAPAINQLKNFTDDNNNPEDRLTRQTGAEAATFEGYKERLKLIFEETPSVQTPARPRNVILIDRSVPQATFAEIIKAAEGIIDRANISSRFALVTFPTNSQRGYQVMSFEEKKALKTALAGLERENGTADVKAAYDNARALVIGARPPQGQTENAANTDTFTLYTLNTTAVPATLGEDARKDKIAFNVVGFKAPANVTPVPAPAANQSLDKLAKDSGGVNNTASSAKEAIKEATKALQGAMGESESLITTDLSDDVVKSGTTFETLFKLGDAAVEGPVEVRWFFDSSDETKLTFTCVAPNNAVTNATISDLSDDESQATCALNNAAAGEWKARATATADTGPVEVEVVSKFSGSPVELSANIEGGTKTDNRKPLLLVKLAGTFPITNATIKAQFFDATSNSETPVKTFTLNKDNDAARNGDARANDGIYTLSLADQLPPGSYVIALESTTGVDSMFNPVQIFASAATPAPGATPVGSPIQRLAETEFVLERDNRHGRDRWRPRWLHRGQWQRCRPARAAGRGHAGRPASSLPPLAPGTCALST